MGLGRGYEGRRGDYVRLVVLRRDKGCVAKDERVQKEECGAG